MRIPETKIDEIRSTVNIVDVIGSSVRLKKAGKNHLGLCPFHQEKTPSFSVNEEKQMFKCFGCGEGGNVFTFLMKDQGMSFIEAVKQLAERTGITLPQTEEQQEGERENERLYIVNSFASDFYVYTMWKTPAGKKALDYLIGRGYKEETIRAFDIGYAPDGWDGLIQVSEKKKLDLRSLVEAGLVIRKDDGRKTYDRFRDRIIFPIKNQYNKTVGFGARKFEDMDGPKYINSPETSIYHKGSTLYGLCQNKDAIRKADQVILVEGYTDVISLNEHGVPLAVASSGTALTPNQAQLLKRYTSNITLLYDADSAGINAALRGSEVLFAAGLDVSVVNLGDGADPDSYIREHGAEKFREKTENRQSIIQFYASGFKRKGSELSYSEKSKRIRAMISLINNVSDRLTRELMLKEISDVLDTDTKTIFKEFYRKKKADSARPSYNREYSEKDMDSDVDSEETLNSKEPLKGVDRVERDLAQVIVNDPLRAKILLKVIDAKDINSPAIQSLMELVNKMLHTKETFQTADLITMTKSVSIRRMITELSVIPNISSGIKGGSEEEYIANLSDSVLNMLKARRLDRELDELQRLLKDSNRSDEQRSETMQEYSEKIQERKELADLRRK